MSAEMDDWRADISKRTYDERNRDHRSNHYNKIEYGHKENNFIITKIDREKTCPMLIRVFCNANKHNRVDNYNVSLPSEEIQIYTWMDASLKELTYLIKEVYPDARQQGTSFSFSIVYADFRRGAYVMREIGSTSFGNAQSDDDVTLSSRRFQVGDFLDVAISFPRRYNQKF